MYTLFGRNSLTNIIVKLAYQLLAYQKKSEVFFAYSRFIVLDTF